MLQTRLFIVVFLSLLPLRLSAEVNCSVFNAIERIQFAQNRLSEHPADIFGSTDAILIIDEANRLDPDQITIAHNGEISPSDTAFLASYVEDARTLATHLARGNRSAITAYLLDSNYAPRQDRISRILPQLKCNPFSRSGPSNGGQRVMSSVKQDRAPAGVIFEKSAIFLAMVIFLTALAHRTYVLGVAWRIKRRRRSKRFHTHIETQLSSFDIPRCGIILDLSCNGAKVQIDTTETDNVGDHIDIWIINSWHSAKIGWQNAHYMGLRFDHPLRHVFVQTICHPTKFS